MDANKEKYASKSPDVWMMWKRKEVGDVEEKVTLHILRHEKGWANEALGNISEKIAIDNFIKYS